MISLARKLMYDELSREELDGEILDLGGALDASYHKLIKGKHKIRVNNLDKRYGYNEELKFDLEKNFPLADLSYDHIICLNVLEHVFDFNNVLAESFRILKDWGSIIIAVPFMYPVHPCPDDYWRYTGSCLEKLLQQHGFKDITVKPLGYGVFTTSSQLRKGLYKIDILRMLIYKFNGILDALLHLHNKGHLFDQNKYPIGYYAKAVK